MRHNVSCSQLNTIHKQRKFSKLSWPVGTSAGIQATPTSYCCGYHVSKHKLVSLIRPRPLPSILLKRIIHYPPTAVATRFKVWVYGRSLADIVASNPTGGMDVCLLWILCVVQVLVSATGWSLVQGNPTEFGESECDREVSIMRRPWPPGGLLRRGILFFLSDPTLRCCIIWDTYCVAK